MAEFNTQQAQTRWNSLSSGETATLDKIMRGQGTMQDFRKIQSLIGRYDRLASKIFNQAVEALGLAAKSRVDTIATRRSDRNKPLTELQLSRLLDTASKKAWDEAGPELVVIIEESFAAQLAKQDERLSTMFGDKLAQSLDPESGIMGKHLQSMQSLTAGDGEERRWSHRIQDLQEWFADELRRFDGLESRVGAAAGLAVKNVFDAWGTHFFESAPESTTNAEMTEASTYLAQGTAPNTITSQSYTQETLGKIADSLEDLADDNSDDHEQKKANIWWRTLKGLGGFASKAGDAAKSMFGGSWFSTLAKLAGAALVTELMGGHLLDKLTDYLSIDNLKKVGNQVLDFVTDNAKKLASWISDKLDAGGESAEHKAQREASIGVKPQDSQDLKNAKAHLADAERDRNITAASSDWNPFKKGILKQKEAAVAAAQAKVNALGQAQYGASFDGSIPDQGTHPVGVPAQTTAVPQNFSSGQLQPASSTVPAMASRGAGQPMFPRLGSGTSDTRFMGDPATSFTGIGQSSVGVGSAITSVPPSAQTTAQQNASVPVTTASSSIPNLANFKRTPGDDTLTLMNMGMFTN